MGILKLRNAGKQLIKFGNGFAEFIRGVNTIKNIDIVYSNGTGQNIASNYVLYTNLSPGDDGYIQIKSTNNITLIGSGLFNLTITHKPSLTQLDQDINFSFNGSPITITLDYNSKPLGNDIIIDINNRALYIFLISDFINQYSDFDNDALSEVAIFGNVSGYEFQGVIYNEGDWIPRSVIEANDFKYLTLDQNSYYEKDNTYKVKDVNGNISDQVIMPILKLRIAGLTCAPPILETVNRIIDREFELTWNYDSIDYSGDTTTAVGVYVSNDDITYELVPGPVPYPGIQKNINLNDKDWEIFYFKVKLSNRTCSEFSNKITIQI